MQCATCAAPMSFTPNGKFAVCEHCGTTVQVAQTGGGGNLKAELDAVESWWEQARRSYMKKDRHGHLQPPPEEHVIHIVLISIGGILGILSAFAGHRMDWDLVGFSGFFIFPILISLPAALLHQRAENRYKAYKQLEAEYTGRRNAIIDQHQRQG